MRPVVLDASVLVACPFKDGRARHTLLTTRSATFIAPTEIVEEARRQLPRIARRTGLATNDLNVVLGMLLERVEVMPRERYGPWELKAKEVARAVQAGPDWPYVALELAESAPVWSYDNDFRRMNGIRALATSEVEER